MTSEINPAEHDQLPERPMQFTLRQALLAVGLLCVILALFRAVGVEIGTGFLIASGLALLSVIALVRRQWLLATFPLLVLLAVVGHLLPTVSSGSPSKRIMCSSNLKNIAQFLLDYHHRKGAFPPAYVADKNGRPMHSWRVLILPDVDPNLYAQYRFDEPWDGPNNSKLASLAENPFRCPSDVGDGSEHETSYVVVVGPKTAFPGDKCVALSDITPTTTAIQSFSSKWPIVASTGWSRGIFT